MQNMKNFLIAFAAGIVLFGVLAAMIPKIVFGGGDEPQPPLPADKQGETQPPDDLPTSGQPSGTTDGKTFTAIVGGYDAKSGELDGLLFVKADREHERFVIAAVPTALHVTVTSTDPATGVSVKTNVRLKDFPILYRGTEKNRCILDTMQALTGMEIDYYAFFDMNTALKLFEKTGGLYYTVGQDMVYVGEGTEAAPEINLKAGGQVLGARQILSLLRFSTYTTDEHRNDARRAATQADFVSEALKQILSMEPDALMSGVGEVLAGCETNFTAADFKDHFSLISKFGEYSDNSVIMTVDLADPLEFTYSQKLFENYK